MTAGIVLRIQDRNGRVWSAVVVPLETVLPEDKAGPGRQLRELDAPITVLSASVVVTE